MKAALATPCLPHMPFHPSCFLGYGAAILGSRYDVEVIDLNAELYFKNRTKLKPILDSMDKSAVMSDTQFLQPFYNNTLDPQIDGHYEAIPWRGYTVVYVTPPSWFPMVPAESVLRLSHAVNRVSPDTKVFFLGNSIGTWTSEEELRKNGVQTVHLNNPFVARKTPAPVRYDELPAPIYDNREKYLFDLLPFALKHGCPWGKCRFCSLSRGWNSGCLERSARDAAKELERLIDRYDPKVLICRDHSLNGRNLIEFCGHMEASNKPWCGQSRADLSETQVRALGRAGCRAIFFGLESGSDRMLKAFNKGITAKQMSDFIKRLHSNGIGSSPSVVIGAPGEGEADFDKTIQFVTDHRRYFEVVNVYPFMATPASELIFQGKQIEKSTPVRLFRFVQKCEEMGLKVCFGEQSIEYFLFSWMKTRRPVLH